MAFPLLVKIDLTTFQTENIGLNARQLSFLGGVYAKVEASTIGVALDFLKSNFGILETVLDVTSLKDSNEDVMKILDAGAIKIIVTNEQAESFQQAHTIEKDRLVFAATTAEGSSSNADGTLAIFYETIEDKALTEALSKGPPSSTGRVVYANVDPLAVHKSVELAKAGAVPVIEAASLSLQPSPRRDQISVTDLILVQATSDREDGLFSTLVTDERGVALGLVYSSRESVAESLLTGRGVYQSRKRGLWYKGESSGDVQELVRISFDCDSDCILFVVRQKGRGFCHLGTATCFGQYKGLSKLQKTLQERKISAPTGSYTARLFSDPTLLKAKIKEEADELCEATKAEDIAFEAADLIYFAMSKCVAAGVTLEEVERNLDVKSMKVNRRKGDAKRGYIDAKSSDKGPQLNGAKSGEEAVGQSTSKAEQSDIPSLIKMTRYDTSTASRDTVEQALKRPSQRSTDMIMNIVKPIIDDVRKRGDTALLEYTHKFEKATSLKSPALHAPFPPDLMVLAPETKEAIDISFNNIYKFHAAQKEERPLSVETMPGVVCSRFARPIERVGLYVPGGTAVLPSTALMLGIPALVAGCKTIVLASPPRSDGTLTPEIIYAAHKVGASSIVLAGGAQAVAALAYGTESTAKVDKILGPGNQFVTAAKMLVSNDTVAGVAIDMPAGPSEVLVVADSTSNPAFVAADLLSQAEHGLDSQVILIAVGMSEDELQAVENELHRQASALPRVDIVKGAIDHSVTLVVRTLEEAMKLSNEYAPEHLILQNSDADKAATMVENAGSVFIGPWTPESVGDYSAGVNHSLPTYGYARQYSGVNLGSYVKHITSSKLTKEGLQNVGPAVMRMAAVEELEAHRRAVSIRLAVQ